jgi:biopolymer transport protein ExbB
MNGNLKRMWMRGVPLLVLVVSLVLATAASAQDEVEPAVGEDVPALEDTAAVDTLAGAVEEAAPEAAAPAEEAKKKPMSGVLELFQTGGLFMWPLLLTSVIGLAVILERLFTLQRAHTNTRKLMEKILQDLKSSGVGAAIDTCTRTRGPIAAILHAGLLKAHRGPEAVEKAIENAGTIEMSFLQRGLIWLATVANIAPLLGFLGTVSGMINAFEAIAAAEQVSAKVVAKGISEALVTTATGLLIAIPVQAFHNYFVARIDRFIIEMEESSVELVDALTEGSGLQTQG